MVDAVVRKSLLKTARTRVRELGTVETVAAAVLLLYVFTALTGGMWAPSSPTAIAGRPFVPPGRGHLLGTDQLGRDVFSRVVHGARPVLALALSATALGVAVGTSLGLMAGYLRGWFDEVAMRIVDILISVPPLIIALVIVGGLGSSQFLLVLTVGVLYAPRVARVIRAATLDVVSEDFVTIARARGESAWAIAFRELLPNVTGTLFVEFAIRTGYAVIFIGSMGFLGFGAPPPTPEWGLMINEGRNHISTAPWTVLGPGLAMAFLVVSLNLFTQGVAQMLGDSLVEQVEQPK